MNGRFAETVHADGNHSSSRVRVLSHHTVYREPGRFAGWPANYGIWSWDSEVVVGFTVGWTAGSAGAIELPGLHYRDAGRAFVPMQARSSDGGRSWTVGPTPCAVPGDGVLSADEHVIAELKAASTVSGDPGAWGGTADGHRDPVDFTAPGFALMGARTGLHAGARSWWYASADRCTTWNGPHALPDFGMAGVSARTDYQVTGPRTCTLFLTGTKNNGREGRTFCARTDDGGVTFRFRSWIGTDRAQGFEIMPASVVLPNGRWLVAVRVSDGDRGWIEVHRSADDCASWQRLSTAVPDIGHRTGNPPTLTRTVDGHLVITYGRRGQPYGIYAVLSSDDGQTWCSPTLLQSSPGSPDLGYPRTFALPDATMVTAYYRADSEHGERYLEITRWTT